jgi:hypothetical protein
MSNVKLSIKNIFVGFDLINIYLYLEKSSIKFHS